jgi:tetratricopeptide (TPR) repeat protein
MRTRIPHLLILVALGQSFNGRLSAHGGYHEEIRRTDEQLATSPDNAELWFHRGFLNSQHGDWQQSLLDLEKVGRLAPGKFPVDLVRGQALAAGGQLEAARTVLTDFITSRPEVPEALSSRARVCMKLGNTDDAVADFKAALQKSKQPEPDLFVDTADALIAQRHPEEAVKVLQDGMAKLGDLASLAIKALELQQTLGLYDGALSSVAVMQKSAPRPEPWMARRASILAKAGRLDEARTAWQALADHLAKLPNLERGSHAMSVLAEESQKALAELNPGAKTDDAKPHAPAVQVTQTDPKMMFPSRSVLGPGSKYEEELDRMDRLILQEPANALYRFQRGELNLLDGKWKWAREDCEEAGRLAPGKFPVDRLQAQILDGEGKSAEAKALLDRFIIANPKDSVGYAARARVLMKLAQVEGSLSDYRSALANQATPEANLFLEVANALRANGRKQEAIEVFTRALKLHKEEPTLVTEALELEASMGAFDAALTKVEAMQKTSPRPELWMAKKAVLLEQAGRKEESREAWLALQQRIAALPNLERGTQPLNQLAAQAKDALAASAASPTTSSPPNALAPTGQSKPIPSSNSLTIITTAPVALPPSR